MRFFYNIFIYTYLLLIKVAALFKIKASLWIDGRKNTCSTIKSINPAGKNIVWVHAASLGEFEQGRPVIEAIRKDFPNVYILLTFFSPSGYEIRKNYNGADKVMYLPIDTPANASYFISHIKPAIAIFIKYEYWFNYLKELNDNKIPVFFVSAIFRTGQHFFKPWGTWFRKQLRKVDWFFVQHQHSLELLQSIGIKQVTVSGDTRFDRVKAIAGNAKSIPEIETFKNNKLLLVAGSTWPVDENILLKTCAQFSDKLKIIIAPHEVHTERIGKLTEKYGNNSLKFSEISKSNPVEANILIIDSIGILSSIYQYADFVFIGGGFGKGIHNILEAATFGGPIFFGPNYHKFQEARELLKDGGAISINNADELRQQLENYLDHPLLLKEKAAICRNYVIAHTGATSFVMAKVKEVLTSGNLSRI